MREANRNSLFFSPSVVFDDNLNIDRRKKKKLNGLFVFLFCNRLENDWTDVQSEKLFARFITLLGDLTYAGFNEIKLSTRPETIIDIPNFVMPQPKKTGNERQKKTIILRNDLHLISGFIVRNLSAFTILQSIFQQVRSSSTCFIVS